MTFWELFLIAIGLSMDAFAIAICKGLSVQKIEKKHLIITGLWFGGSQAVMPLIGYFLGTSFRAFIENIDHWIAFILLTIIGINMIRESREKTKQLDASFSAKVMFPLAIADSIDALAAGVTFSFFDVSIVPTVLLIGVTTFVLSAVGLKIGNRFGEKYKSKAELLGGIILIAMGVSILVKDLGVF
ncbi:MAG TPA: manganese efflux pump MntP family protein [Lachnospiraceae bacterium]|nr:manganese efflux pump MntP family protein [Lachnospiraceae bacterium]